MPLDTGVRGTTNPARRRRLLTKDLRLAPIVYSEDFEVNGDWTCPVGTIATNTTEKKSGTQAIKLTTNVGSLWYGYAYKTVNWDLSADGWNMNFWVYIHDVDANYSGNVPIVQLCNDSARTIYMQGFLNSVARKFPCWVRWSIAKLDFQSVGGGTFANPIIRLLVRCNAITSAVVSVTWDSMIITPKTTPTIQFHFDDCYVQQYTVAFPYMAQYGIPGTLYVPTGNVGLNSTYYTVANLQYMARNGWALAHHTRSHIGLNTLSQSAQQTEIQNGITDMVSWGLPTPHFGYPFGAMTDYDANAFISLANLNVVTARTMIPVTSFDYGYLPMDAYQIPAQNTTSIGISTLKSYVDNAILRNSSLIFVIHGIGTGGGAITVADFKSLVDYVAKKARDGLITPITIDDYYKASLGSVTVAETAA